MKKSVLFVVLLVIISLLVQTSFVFAQNDSDDTTDTSGVSQDAVADLSDFEKAYACLEDIVQQRGYDSLTPEEQALALLALGYDSGIQGELRSALADSSYNNICWPSDSCRLKDTALAMIALEHINQPTNTIENWFLEQTTEPDDLAWYLQIDTDQESDCTISYEGGSKQVTVQDDKKITGAGGSCLSSAYNGFWLEVDEDCYDNTLEISCDQAFVTSLTYRKKSGSGVDAPYYISAITHSAPAEGKTQEKVNALCFKEKNQDTCSYEGTLWAALALRRLGKDTSAYIPYLAALAPNNERYLPSAFLYMLTGYDEHFVSLINQQKSEGYWQTTSDQSRRQYDTSIALLALQGRSAEQAETAIDYLLETQQGSGCWNNVRDTSFVLYSASPKNPALSSARTDCEDSGYYCVSSEQTCEDAIGTIQSNYYCSSLGQTICCTVYVEEELPDAEPSDDYNTCQEAGYYCKSFCSDSEEIKSAYSCSGIEDCCGPETTTTSGRSYWRVWLLVLLIILLILAIIFRNQVKIWVFRTKNKFKKRPVSPHTRPGIQFRGPAGRPGPRPGMRPGMRMQGRPPMRPGMRRPGMRPGPGRPGQHRPFPKENALQDTLRKLRDMGKK